MTYLIYASVLKLHNDSKRVFSNDTNELYMRAVPYRGGTDPIEYGEKNSMPGEYFVNSVEFNEDDAGA